MKIQIQLDQLTVSGLFLNWTWFFLPSVSYICVIIEPLLAFLANIVGSGRSPMNLRMITHTTREACSQETQSDTAKCTKCLMLFLPSFKLLIPVSCHSHLKFTLLSNHVSNIHNTLRKRVQLQWEYQICSFLQHSTRLLSIKKNSPSSPFCDSTGKSAGPGCLSTPVLAHRAATLTRVESQASSDASFVQSTFVLRGYLKKSK